MELIQRLKISGFWERLSWVDINKEDGGSFRGTRAGHMQQDTEGG